LATTVDEDDDRVARTERYTPGDDRLTTVQGSGDVHRCAFLRVPRSDGQDAADRTT